jgi:TonB family protein
MKKNITISLTTFFLFCLACAPHRVLKSVKVPEAHGRLKYCVAKDDTTEFIRLEGTVDFRKKKNVNKGSIKADLNALSRDLYKAASRLIQTEYGDTMLTPTQAFDCLAEAADIYHYEEVPNSNGTIDIRATITQEQIERAINCYRNVPPPPPPEPENEEAEPEIFPKEQARSKKAIDKVMDGRKNVVELCLQRQLRKGLHPKGKVIMTFTISPGGTVSDARVENSTVKSPELVKCLKAVVVNTRFKAIAEIEGGMTVTYPFSFN